jgi:hypothetical protein
MSTEQEAMMRVCVCLWREGQLVSDHSSHPQRVTSCSQTPPLGEELSTFNKDHEGDNGEIPYMKWALLRKIWVKM